MMALIRRFFRFFFKADYVYCTIVVFAFMLVISQILEKFSFLNPIEIALSDFEMTDIVFARNIREEPEVDTNIVLVNIGNISRRGIAREIERIAAEKPKVLGIDCSFFKLKNPDDDSMLVSALSKIEKLVLFSELKMTGKAGESRFDTLLFCHPRFARLGNSGFCNIITPGKDEYQTCRTFKPIDSVGGHVERAFSVEIARQVDPSKVEKFLSRKKDFEIINFRGNQDHFYCLDVPDLLGQDDGSGFVTEPELNVSLKGKIVLMGFMGDRFGKPASQTREDKFHTPMNENYAGKAYPDMFGVVIHANIVSMILHDQPIDSMSGLGGVLLAILLCYLNVIFFFYIHESYPSWYDLVVKTTQVLEVFLILGLAVIIYARYSYSLDVTLSAIAVGLCGDILEVYTGAMYNIVGRIRDRVRNLVLKKGPVKVTTEDSNPEEQNSSSS